MADENINEPLADTIAKARKSLSDWSWTDEITAPDEDGNPNDYAIRPEEEDCWLTILRHMQEEARAALDASTEVKEESNGSK